MLRRISLTAAATVAALAGMASAQVPNVISNIPSQSGHACILADGNVTISGTAKTTLNPVTGAISRTIIPTTGMTGVGTIMSSSDGMTLFAVADWGTALPAPGVNPLLASSTFTSTDDRLWTSTDAGATWSAVPLGNAAGRCNDIMSLWECSRDGRFAVGGHYKTITTSACRSKGYIYDRVTNVTTILDDPTNLTGMNPAPGTTTFFANSVSDDGTVVAGYGQGSGSTPVVWDIVRDGSNNIVSATPTRLTSAPTIGGSQRSWVSRDGSTIVNNVFDVPTGGVKWTKPGGSWVSTPIPTNTTQVPTNFNRPTSWLTGDSTSQTVTPSAVSADGSVIVGTINYGPGSGAFMWTAATGTVDLFDYCIANGPTAGIAAINGPVPNPSSVMKDPNGQIVIGIAAFGASYLIKFQPTEVCYPPVFLAPTNTNPVISACSASPSLAPGAVSGTGPFTYQWSKDGSPITLGPTIWGSNITMNNPPTLSLSNAQALDAGVYFCRAYSPVSGPCGPTGFTADSLNFNLTYLTPIQYTTDPAQHGDTCQGAVDLTNAVTVVSSPSNVNFPALTVAGLPRTMTAWNTCTAVNNNIIGASCVGTSNGDVWFKWTPDANVTVRLSTCAVTAPSGTTTVNDTVVSVYTAGPNITPNGSDCTGTEIACNDTTISAFCSTSTQRAGIDQVALTGGQTYFFRVAVKSPFTSNGTNYTSLTITDMATLPIPANDNCSGAIALTASTNTAFSTVNAGTEVASVSCNPTLGSGKDVWFSFSPSSSGDYRISLCGGTGVTTPPVTNPSPAWDSIVTVFDACNGNEIACNNDQGAVEPTVTSCGSSNVGRIRRLALSSGFTYYIRVAGINGALGTETNATATGNINIFPAPAKPANDDCLNATAVSTAGAQPWSVTNQSTVEATLDGANTCGPSVSTSSPAERHRDVWFTFTPPTTPANGWRIQFCGQTWGDTGLSIHTGCPGDASNEVVGGCNNNVGNYASALPAACGTNNNSRIESVTLMQGQTYYIRAVTNTFGTSGTTVSTLTIAETPAGPANDACAGASLATVGTNAYNFNEATSQTLAACSPSDQRGAYDLWYTFTPACDGTFTFLGCAGFSSPYRWNPVISVYPSCTDAISTPSVTLGCAEDYNTAPYPALMSTICTASAVNYPTAIVQNVALQGGTPVTVRLALQDYATNPVPSARAQDPTGNFFIVQNVLCCRGVTCTQSTSNPEAACTAPSGVGAVKTTCGAVCTGNTFQGCCFADFNHDGVQSIDDLFLYFNAYFVGSPWANFGGNGTDTPTIDDLFLYINAYFGTCS